MELATLRTHLGSPTWSPARNHPARKPRAPVAWVPRGATTMSGRKQAAPRNAFGRAAAPPRQLALSQRRNLPKPRSRMPNPQRPAEESSAPQSEVPSRRGKPARPPRPDAPPLIERSRTKGPPQKPNLSIHPLRRPQSRRASQRRKRPAPRCEASPAARPGSPHARKSPEPHLAPRAATPTLTTPTRPATAAAAISPELGLGLAQALSAELAGLSHRLLEAGSASAQQMASARSVPELIEIQARQLKALSEAWLEHTSRISEIYLSAVGPSTRR